MKKLEDQQLENLDGGLTLDPITRPGGGGLTRPIADADEDGSVDFGNLDGIGWA